MPKIIDQQLLDCAKVAYSCRRVDLRDCARLRARPRHLRAGDLLLAEVTKIGQHKRLELTTGRRAHLFTGDIIVVALGARYAPDYFEAVVPDTLDELSLVAGGGVAARLLLKHERVSFPTQLEPLGLIADDKGDVINLERYALPLVPTSAVRPLSFVIMGTAMNSGKSTMAAGLVRGLIAAGLRVGAAKVYGTGAGPDTWLLKDAGAEPVLDVIDAGLISTYRESPERLLTTFDTLQGQLAGVGLDATVIEIGDGLFQRETLALVESEQLSGSGGKNLSQRVDGVLFAASDSLGAKAGVDILLEHRIPLLAVGGLLTRSPLIMRETQDQIGVPILDLSTLQSAEVLPLLQRFIAGRKLADDTPLTLIKNAN